MKSAANAFGFEDGILKMKIQRKNSLKMKMKVFFCDGQFF